MNRREFLGCSANGLGAVALAHLLGQAKLLGREAKAELNGGLHHRARAKRVLHLFMNGGASPMDTFDYKPELQKRHGQKFDPGAGIRVEAATSTPGTLLQSPYAWKRHGQSGHWVSSVFPHLATCVDDLAFIHSMQSKTNVHGPGVYLQTTGFVLPGFPCMGSWVSYGLGQLGENLPAFVVIPDSRGLPYNSKGSFGSGFLPVVHQGTLLRPTAPEPVADLFPPKAPGITRESEAEGLALLDRINREHLAARGGDSRLEGRIASYELAARMQLSAPDALDLSKESDETRKMYGLDRKETADFGTNCLTARRLLERGVRFVQLWSGTAGPTGNWDNHADIQKELTFIATMVDQPIAALLVDLKRRGMLEDTLVVWTTEFGRMPFAQGSVGRDHNGGVFTSWLAGAGVKPGVSYGESDEWAWKAAKDPVMGYDLHATILHLLGIDHTRLTYRHNGADRRLTDVHGHVIRDVLA
jgi:hypothetical protein